MEHDVRASSWIDLQEHLYAGSWNEALGRFRSSWAFRGLPRIGYDLTTSLARRAGTADLEGHLLRNFRKYANRSAVPRDSVWNWLALAQHHGLPTRLLDWTYSPFVAMHFATVSLDDFDVDGVIWCVDFGRTNAELPEPLRQVLREEGSAAFTDELLDRVTPTLQAFDALSPGEFVLFLEPPSLDDRIVAQFALFSLMNDAEASLDRWLLRRPEAYRRIVIPADLKWEVRDKLDQANITERLLHPGLDGLSRWLRRYYLPRSRT